jgi:hypothetical protein
MISRKHKFIFVHVPKCGGSSIEAAFGYDLWDKKKFPNHFCDKQLLLGRDKQTGKYLQHLTISEIFAIYPDIKSSYFSFSFVRNPWGRAVSDYFYYGGPRKQKSFKDFLLSLTPLDPSHSIPQYDFLCDNQGNVTVDFIGRFENLQEDFNIICDKLDIPRQKLPYKMKSKQNKSWWKDMQKTLSILLTNLENENEH